MPEREEDGTLLNGEDHPNSSEVSPTWRRVLTGLPCGKSGGKNATKNTPHLGVRQIGRHTGEIADTTGTRPTATAAVVGDVEGLLARRSRVPTHRYVPSAGAATPVAVHEGVFAVSAPVAGRLIATTSSGLRPLTAPPPALIAPSPLGPTQIPAKLIAQVSLAAPHGARLPRGPAEIVTRGGQLVLTARGVPPNPGSDRYAVWLSGGPSGNQIRLGFVDPGVGRNRHLSTAGALPRAVRA